MIKPLAGIFRGQAFLYNGEVYEIDDSRRMGSGKIPVINKKTHDRDILPARTKVEIYDVEPENTQDSQKEMSDEEIGKNWYPFEPIDEDEENSQ